MMRLLRTTTLLAVMGVGFAVLSARPAGAQERVNRYVARLNVPAAGTGARASVGYEPDVEAWLVHFGQKSRQVNGYRICVFTGGSQEDRYRAYGASSAFQAHFPGISCNVYYNAPTWKVVVGHCLSPTETAILLGQIRLNVSANAFRFPEKFDVAQSLRGFAAVPVGVEADVLNVSSGSNANGAAAER